MSLNMKKILSKLASKSSKLTLADVSKVYKEICQENQIFKNLSEAQVYLIIQDDLPGLKDSKGDDATKQLFDQLKLLALAKPSNWTQKLKPKPLVIDEWTGRLSTHPHSS